MVPDESLIGILTKGEWNLILIVFGGLAIYTTLVKLKPFIELLNVAFELPDIFMELSKVSELL